MANPNQVEALTRKPLSRRKFIKIMAGLLGTATLAGCAETPPTPRPAEATTTPTAFPTIDDATATQNAIQATAIPQGREVSTRTPKPEASPTPVPKELNSISGVVEIGSTPEQMVSINGKQYPTIKVTSPETQNTGGAYEEGSSEFSAALLCPTDNLIDAGNGKLYATITTAAGAQIAVAVWDVGIAQWQDFGEGKAGGTLALLQTTTETRGYMINQDNQVDNSGAGWVSTISENRALAQIAAVNSANAAGVTMQDYWQVMNPADGSVIAVPKANAKDIENQGVVDSLKKVEQNEGFYPNAFSAKMEKTYQFQSLPPIKVELTIGGTEAFVEESGIVGVEILRNDLADLVLPSLWIAWRSNDQATLSEITFEEWLKKSVDGELTLKLAGADERIEGATRTRVQAIEWQPEIDSETGVVTFRIGVTFASLDSRLDPLPFNHGLAGGRSLRGNIVINSEGSLVLVENHLYDKELSMKSLPETALKDEIDIAVSSFMTIKLGQIISTLTAVDVDNAISGRGDVYRELSPVDNEYLAGFRRNIYEKMNGAEPYSLLDNTPPIKVLTKD